MPLPTFDTQDAIPEAFRGEYTEKEGKWVPKSYGDADAVAAQNRKLLDERKRFEAEAQRYRSVFGERKPEEIEEILRTHAQAEEERQRKAGEFDKILSDRVSKAEKKIRDELEPRAKERDEYARRYEDLSFDVAVRELAAEAGIPEKNHKAVIKITRGDHLKLVDGKVVVLDAAGDVRSIDPKEFFAKEFKSDYPELYAAGGGSGGGSSSSERRAAGGGTGAIDIRDPQAFLANVGKIAKGQIATRG